MPHHYVHNFRAPPTSTYDFYDFSHKSFKQFQKPHVEIQIALINLPVRVICSYTRQAKRFFFCNTGPQKKCLFIVGNRQLRKFN